MMLSQTTEYALRLMVWLAQQEPECLFKTEGIAAAIKAPEAYLYKILQTLNRSGLVLGRKGIKGGYRLTKPASQISLFDVIMAIEPSQNILSCPLGLPNHEILCPLHQKLNHIHEEMKLLFGNCHLSELVKKGDLSPLCKPH